MDNINVLVFPCGSEIGLELHRALKDIRFISLFGASSVSDHGEWVYKNYRGDIPFVTDDSFIDRINQCIDEWNIDFIFPAMDSVILELSSHRQDLHAQLLTSSDEAVAICRSKKKTYQALEGCSFLPKIYDSILDVSDYPCFLKPSVGQGSQGAKIIHSQMELEQEILFREEEQVICEYLPGDEYTIDCFTDRHGILRYTACRGRYRVRNGISVNSKMSLPDKKVEEIAEIINKKMAFRGAWFFQLKRNSLGEYRLLECATRIAGTMCIERAAGINLPLLTILDAMEMDIAISPQVSDVIVDRALENVYHVNILYNHVLMDFDDTIIVHGQVNMTAIQFIYQCVAKNISITLLTRHDTDVRIDLRKYKICEDLFSEIICIPRTERKVDHVSPTNDTIFIDDSFAERDLMNRMFGIRCFGVESLEALLDYHR